MTTERLLVSDAPVGRAMDGLGLIQYVGPLARVIVSEATETPFTVGIFGPWGSGKSSLLRMIAETLEADYPERTIRVDFNPWVYRNEPNMLLPLLHTLQDTLSDDRSQRFSQTVRRLGSVISTLTANIVLGKVSGGSVKLDDIKNAAEEYSKARGLVESEMRRLRSTLQAEADRLAESGVRLVILIDDLDRCEPDEIVDLLESMKLFFDLRNIFVVMAIAKDVVDRGVAVRYRDFGFTTEKVIEIGNEYLDKMIQLPLYLSTFNAPTIGAFIAGLNLPPDLAPHIELLQKIVYPNPRHIKRVVNLAIFTHAVARDAPGRQVPRLDLLLRLIVLRIQSPALYRASVARPDLLADLEAVYQDRLRPDDTDGFTRRHGTELAELAQEGVHQFYGLEPYFEDIFSESSFGEVTGELVDYITMLGG
ncbi:AAA family ATPase [Streptomyces sp. S3(2020)]|uniref:KAP family P-loop NTPase fold protein n=1 Tax=Streptomyces sp. S3(2020) TaxID=2732044 RepID=UPI00148811AA|nr:P-loop NTPase fold protein [Streptomyces sp. S3(2020)]NNN32187.1 AAA family ATPase [Streptomyces sp. S3(2020)]